MSNIRDIANVEISIESPVAETSSYSKMLIATKQPTGTAFTDVKEIKELSDLTTLGYATTDEVYLAMQIAFRQTPKPESIYLVARNTVTVDEETTTEDIDVTLARALTANSNWYGFAVIDTDSVSTTMLTKAAEWAEDNGKIFVFTWVTGNIPITITGYNRTIAIYGGDTESGTNEPFSGVAWMAKCFGYECGSETWAFKSLTGIEESALSNATVTTLRAANANFYQKYADRYITLDGKVGSGEWIDVIRFRDWLVNEIENKIVGFFATNQKVAFTDAGITAVQGVIDSVLKRGQALGGIAETQFDDDGNPTYGYTITVPKSMNVSSSDKQARRLTGVSFEARIAGAIHYTTITGKLIY